MFTRQTWAALYCNITARILDKEDNNKIKDVIFEFLTSSSANEGGSGSSGLELNRIDAEDPEISDYNMIPDTCKLADQLRVCLQESDEVPADYTRLFDTRLYSISTSLVPAAIKVLEKYQKTCFDYFLFLMSELQIRNLTRYILLLGIRTVRCET